MAHFPHVPIGTIFAVCAAVFAVPQIGAVTSNPVLVSVLQSVSVAHLKQKIHIDIEKDLLKT